MEMDRDYLLINYPNIMALLDDFIDEGRFLVVVDPNIEEEADEADVFDPTEYNWMIFFPDRIKNALGDELFAKLSQKVEELDIVDEFFADDEDLFGVWSEASEDEITLAVLRVIDELAKEVKVEDA
jgi:nucleotide-binding universal stress UspA family protein